MIRVGDAAPIAETGARALLVAARSGPDLDLGGTWVVEQLPWIADRFEEKEFTGKSGEILAIPVGDGLPYEEIVIVGLGDEADEEEVRRAAGSAARALKASETVATTLHAACAGAAGAAVQGIALGAYTFDRHKSEPKPSKIETVLFVDGTADDTAQAEGALVVAEAVVVARDLVNESAMYKSPESLAAVATDLGEAHGFAVRVLDEDEIEAEGLGGLRGVSLGADNPPRLVELTYEPEDAAAFLALVGKGIVFDSGGLSLKPAGSMEEMKTDMSGAAAVFAAVTAIARLGLPIKVLGITPLTENMPGGGALRPGDVLHTRNGKTIEVLNTDAEGRLVLADGLALAVERSPDLVVDLATLTGACMVALGKKIAGLLGTDEAVDKVAAAAAAAGERVWHLPLPDDYRKAIDSDVADMKNVGDRWGGAITAGLLLREFAGDGAWAHLDIAGPARADDAEGYIPKGGTGFGVRTIVELAREMAGG